MLLIDQLKERTNATEFKLNETKDALKLPALHKRKAELDLLQQDPDLYKDLKNAQKINTEAKQLSDLLNELAKMEKSIAEINDLIELLQNEHDEQFIQEAASLVAQQEKAIEQLYLTTLLKGEYDSNSAIVSIHAGAGGADAMDWAGILYRMYRMYADRHGYSIEEIERIDGDEAGIKSITVIMGGRNAYGFLRAEKGIHRLVRISPFDSQGRRHTSFASVEVMPEINEEIDIKILPEELRIDTYRAGGAGGQHINKTDSAVRITHIPTGIVVQCQNERSQVSNKETALKVLYGKLYEKKERERVEKVTDIKGELKKIEWGSQIRSYTFHPSALIKDLRTDYESTDLQSILDGKIDDFIFDYLKKTAN